MLERHSFISKLIFHIGIILVFLMIFLVMYAPVFQKNFYYRDDYVLLRPVGEPAAIMDEAIKSDGRLLNGIMAFYLWGHARSSNSANTMRLVAIIGMALFASVIWATLKRFRVRSDHAFLMSTLVCTLPCSQLLMLSTLYTNFIYSSLLSSLSALILFNVIKEESRGRTYEIVGVTAAIILLVTSFTIYQSGAMTYWVAGVIFYLTSDTYDFLKKYRRPLIKYFFIGLISMVIYYVVFLKIVPFVMNYSMERANLVAIHQIPVKLIKFIVIPFMNAINLWNIYPTIKFAIFISMIIFSDIIISLLQAIKEKKQFLLRNFRQKYSLILCLLILSYLPSLIVEENAYDYRTLLSPGAALSILFCFGLINIVEFFKFIPNFSAESRKTIITVLLTILVIVTTFQARHNALTWPSSYQLDIQLWERWDIFKERLWRVIQYIL